MEPFGPLKISLLFIGGMFHIMSETAKKGVEKTDEIIETVAEKTVETTKELVESADQLVDDVIENATESVSKLSKTLVNTTGKLIEDTEIFLHTEKTLGVFLLFCTIIIIANTKI